MAYGNEIALVLDWDAVGALCRRYGLTWHDPGRTSQGEFFDEVVEPLQQLVAGPLRDSHLALLEAAYPGRVLSKGPVQGGFQPFGDSPHVEVRGVWRPVGTFALELFGDEGELGHRWPTEHRVGVSLWSRYVPVWLDIDDYLYGGSHSPLVFDAAVLDRVEQARAALAAEVSEFADAALAVQPRWY